MSKLINCFTFGSCDLHASQRLLIEQGLLAHPFIRFGISGRPYALSSGAAVQLHEFCAGERTPAEAIRQLAYGRRFPSENQRLSFWEAGKNTTETVGTEDETEIVLIELSTPIEPFIGDAIVNLNKIRRCINEPLRRANVDPKIVGKWGAALSNVGGDLRERAEALLQNWPKDFEDGGLARFGVENLRVRRLSVDDMVRDLERLRDRIGVPMALQLYNFRYMPDGRAVEWPAGFRAEQLEVARRMGLPTFDLTPLVSRLGFKRLISHDMNHWRRETYPLQAYLTYDFLAGVLGRPRLATHADSATIRHGAHALLAECADTLDELLAATRNASPSNIHRATTPSGPLVGRAQVARQALAGLTGSRTG